MISLCLIRASARSTAASVRMFLRVRLTQLRQQQSSTVMPSGSGGLAHGVLVCEDDRLVHIRRAPGGVLQRVAAATTGDESKCGDLGVAVDLLRGERGLERLGDPGDVIGHG